MSSRPILVGSAAALGLAGLSLLFAPAEILGLLGIENASRAASLLAQLLGSAWLGLAYGNWTARGLAVGGIHGRAIVIGNLMNATTGALVLLRHAVGGASAAVWISCLLLAATAMTFAWLLRTAPRVPASKP